MPYVVEDNTYRPIVILTLDGTPTDDDFDQYLDVMQKRLDENEGERVGYVLDALSAGAATAAQRKRQAEWMDAHREQLEATSLGIAFVFESAVMRFILSSVMLMSRLPMDYTVVASVDEALAWFAEQGRKWDTPMPVVLVERLAGRSA